MRKLSLVLLTLLISIISFGQYPDPTGYVNDNANVIDGNIENRLESKLSSYEETTSIEITILTIKSLGGKSITDYSQELFTEWGIGKRETDAGLLLLVAVDDREWRFHTGYGLEPYITDHTCKRIGEDNFPSHFREGEYGEGIEAGINDVIDKLGNDSWELREKYKAEQEREIEERNARIGRWLLNFLIGALILAFVIFLLYKNHKRIQRKKLVKEKIEKTKINISEITSKIAKEREYILSSKMINRSELLDKLDSISYDSSVDNLWSNEKNLITISDEYNKYKFSFDRWKQLRNKNRKIEKLYDNLKHQRNMTESKNDFLNRDNFVKLLNKMIEGSNVIEPTLTLGTLSTESLSIKDLNETLNYLESSYDKYEELYDINKEIISKKSGVEYRRSRTETIKGVNKDHLLKMLETIENNFSCVSISKNDLEKSLKYLDIKLNDFDRVSEINRGVIALRNRKGSLLKELLKIYLNITKTYKRLKKNHPDVLQKYLPNFRFEKKYYEERYMENINRLVDLSYKAILKLDFKHADDLRKSCGDTKTAFVANLDKLINLEKRIENAKRKISEYESELSAKRGSLYNKTYKKVKDSDVETSTIRKWNSLQEEITKFHKTIIHFSDVILVMKHVKKLYDSLLSVKKQAQRDIDAAEEERRRKKREEERRKRREREEREAAERRRRRRSSSSSYGGFGSSGGGSFGGFGGGRSGGGGASGGW
ncbi:MAG: putative hydrolase [uncultured marine phage]|uniref:Putative hydrolase n=1 Tax=uncultured marine phage TaxID=707152 RepID=A0A8D9CC53_9VIRU|nr:MAG: putative hydrolase [uncultured marine phage]